MSTSVTRKASNLDDKVKDMNLCDGGKSCRAVAEEMGVGRTQIMNIIKRKSEILRNPRLFTPPQCRTKSYKDSFFPTVLDL